jgi:hypothetical protein
VTFSCHSTVAQRASVSTCARHARICSTSHLKFRALEREGTSRSCAQPETVEQDASQQTAASPTPSNSSPGGRTLADVWQPHPSETSAEDADNSLLQELKNRTQRIVDSAGSGSAAQTSSGPKSFMDAIRSAGQVISNPVPGAGTPPRMSKRSEDEEIRRTRQQRMAEQGLDGSAKTGWRTGDKNDEGELSEAENFSQLLRQPSSDSESEQGPLSAEQFTMYAIAPSRTESKRYT